MAATKTGRRSQAAGGRGRSTKRNGSSGGRGSRAAGRGNRNGSSPKAASNGSSPRRGGGAALDALLSDAVMGTGRRWWPGTSALKAGVKLGTRPDKVARRGAALAAELARIVAGRSEVEPSKGDRRFKDPAWLGNPAFKRLGQSYLATAQAIDKVLSDADLDWVDERRVRFAAENVVDALAPSNFPVTNPAVIKAAIDSGGLNFVKGLKQFAQDMAKPPRVPNMVDSSEFKVGENIAVTPGKVVHRTDVFELIQYKPQTAKVREKPLLVVPPMINKYYVTDLAPDRSMIEFLVKGGQQVLVISWRNPDERQADWSLDTYVGAVIEALDATEAITGSKESHAAGLCAGGITLALAAAVLEDRGEQERLASITLAVCVLDNARAGTTAAFVDRNVAQLAVAESARRGYLDGRSLAGVFAWLRPNDLIWNYWINNYLLGKEPPAFDVLFWNADTTNMPAALHRDFIGISLDNTLVKPGETEVMGTKVDLSKLTMDSYLLAGISDHIAPWQNAYATTQLLGSEPRFVLSTSGHIAAMVNPPGNEKASFQVAARNPESADDWLEGASKKRGTWWVDWLEWLGERSGDEKPAKKRLGGAGYKPLEDAPGKYVLAEAGS
jgi:polyhydroxyalkanoate synthase